MAEMITSPVWGNQQFQVTQNNGDNYPDVPDSWYAYAVDWGLPYGHHPGIDVGMPNGTKLYAIAPGVVEFGGEDLISYRPNHVQIRWQDGSRNEVHIYAHMNATVVKTGDVVRAGQYLGVSGEQTVKGTRTPDGSGPHLHFERRDMNAHKSIDPRDLLKTGNVTPWGGEDKSNWPTAEKIDSWIAVAERSNQRQSPVHGMGETFVKLGEKYGVNPGVVVAIMQRESQMGADGSVLPSSRFYNFSGITDPGGTFFGDRKWRVFGSPTEGLAGTFELLTKEPYKSTDGSLGAIMEHYSPRFENDWGDMWNIFHAVAKHLGITLEENTNIYSRDGNTGAGDSGPWAGALIDALRTAGERASFGILGIALLALGLVILIGPTNVIPGSKLAKVAKKAVAA